MDLPLLREPRSERVPEPVALLGGRSGLALEPAALPGQPPELWLEKPEPAALMEPLLEEMDWQQTPAGKCHRYMRLLAQAQLGR